MRRAARIASAAVAVAATSLLLGSTAAAERTAAQSSLIACADRAATSARIACLERATRTIASDRSVDAAIRELERAARHDRLVAIDCHMALHPIGAEAGTRLAGSTRPLPLERPRSFCHEGYVHGMQVAWLERAPTRALVADGARTCNSADPVADWTCGHSLGHALAARAGDSGMASAMPWCARAWHGALRLALDRDAFLSTCAKGALMELTLRDEREDRSDRSTSPCTNVRENLLQWCEAHAWLRADLDRDRAATTRQRLDACDQLARTVPGRRSCAAIVGRALTTPAACASDAADLRRACRAAARLGPIDPSTIPAPA